MSTGNEHDDRVNIGAKLLSGEEYGGHAFWDTELFMLPFFSYVFPHTAKNLETYRYRMLEAAKANAAKMAIREHSIHGNPQMTEPSSALTGRLNRMGHATAAM